MAPVHTQKPTQDTRFFGLLQPRCGILLAGKMRDGTVDMREVSAALRSRGFSDAYFCLKKNRRMEAHANLFDLVSAGRALYFKDDPLYSELICQPIKAMLSMLKWQTPQGGKAKAEFFKHGVELPEK